MTNNVSDIIKDLKKKKMDEECARKERERISFEKEQRETVVPWIDQFKKEHFDKTTPPEKVAKLLEEHDMCLYPMRYYHCWIIEKSKGRGGVFLDIPKDIYNFIFELGEYFNIDLKLETSYDTNYDDIDFPYYDEVLGVSLKAELRD